MRHYLLTLALLLVACGGSGSNDASPTTPTPPPVTPPISDADLKDSLSFVLPDNIQQNQAIGLLAQLSGNHQIKHISWKQLAGPQVFIAAPNSQLVSFDVPQSGDYRFEVNVETKANQSTSKVLDFSVQANNSAQALVRLDHAVSEGGKVSLRAEMSQSPSIANNVSWKQTSGPQVTLDQSQAPFLFFTAPRVQRDNILEFEAEVTANNGQKYRDKAYVLVKNTDINEKDGFFPKSANSIVTAELQPYVVDGPYANNLVACTYNNTINQACDFNRLPLLGMQTLTPSVDDVMQRVVVSHPWMGDRFRQFLQQSVTSVDMLKLLRAVTAVVISYDIRPSFYWSATGAIYLDANNFWLTPQERDSLNDRPDFRSDFGRDLQFSIFWRYVKNKKSYLFHYPHENRITRDFSALESNVSWLMYHELAHANDFFPPVSWQNITRSQSPLSSSSLRKPDSDELVELYPLNSSQLKALAQVRFNGQVANSQQKSLSDTDVSSEFTPDRAITFYSYYTPREDYALLFERYMMEYRLGVQADVAIISKNNNPNFKVSWGQRNRFNTQALLPRVKLAVNNILPELAFSPQDLTTAEDMQPGVPWRDNLIINGNARTEKQAILMMHYHHSDKAEIKNTN